MVEGVGFVIAGRLALGNAIVTRAGPALILAKIEWKQGKQAVYNFEVEDDHSYFVGSANGGLWVHNAGPCDIEMLSPYDLTATHGRTKSNSVWEKFQNAVRTDGEIKESIKYFEHDGQKYIVDGHHRVMAARKVGIGQVPAQKVQLPYSGYKSIDDLFSFDDYGLRW